jgi:hypothetical protein
LILANPIHKSFLRERKAWTGRVAACLKAHEEQAVPGMQENLSRWPENGRK